MVVSKGENSYKEKTGLSQGPVHTKTRKKQVYVDSNVPDNYL